MWLGVVFLGVVGLGCVHSGVHRPCPLWAVKLGCEGSSYRRPVCEFTVACRFPGPGVR